MTSLSDFSDAQANTLLNTHVGVDYYVAAFSDDPAGTGANEITAAGSNGYARQLVRFTTSTARNAPSDRAVAIPLPSNMAANTLIPYTGIFTAVTAGTFIFRFPSGTAEIEATYDASTGVWETKGVHSLSVDNVVGVVDLVGATVPGGLTSGHPYYVKAIPTTHTFTLSATSSGGANTLLSGGADGGAVIRYLSTQLYQASNVVTIGAGNLQMEL